MASNKHPTLMGNTFKQAWPEIYSEFKVIFADIERTDQGHMMKDTCLFLQRHGYLEEYVLFTLYIRNRSSKLYYREVSR